MTAISLGPEPGWLPVAPLIALGPIRSFVSDDAVGDRLRVRYYRREVDNALVGKVWFGPRAEGPPGHAHGGSMAAVLDEAMGAAAWMLGHPVVARTVTIEFRSMLPLERVVMVEATIQSAGSRWLRLEGRISDDRTPAFATASGLFMRLSPDRLRRFHAGQQV